MNKCSVNSSKGSAELVVVFVMVIGSVLGMAYYLYRQQVNASDLTTQINASHDYKVAVPSDAQLNNDVPDTPTN